MSVSIIIPTYNRTQLLVRSIRSALDQTYDDVEIIVVDDHSSVPAEDVVERAPFDTSSIRIYRHSKNRDVAAARNTGVRLSTGDWVAFLDDDDAWHPEKIERQLEGIRRSNAGATYTGIEHRLDGRTTAVKTPTITGNITEELLQRNFIGTPSAIMARRDLVEKVGGFDVKLPISQDWDFVIRLSLLARFDSIAEPLTIQHRHENHQMSDDYETRRRITAPLLLEKHRETAMRFGVHSEFEATIEAELGWVAVNNGDYARARTHFFRSLRYHRTTERVILLLLTLGGPRTYSLFRRFKRRLPGGYKFKRMVP